MAPTLLKAKGGKAFGALTSLSDAESLQTAWKVSSRVSHYLDFGERVENLSWRLWHLRQVMVDDNAEASTSSGSKLANGKHAPRDPVSSLDRIGSETNDAAAARGFNALSAAVASKLEAEKREPISELSAPHFRWTDGNDMIRHRSVMRIRRRDEKGPSKTNQAVNQKASSPGQVHAAMSTDGAVHKGGLVSSSAEHQVETIKHRKRRRSVGSDTSSESGSNSPCTSYSTAQRPAERDEDVKVPPVCWRLTKAKSTRQKHRPDRDQLQTQSTAADLDGQSAWTIQQIEDAERELREQGIELSGPFTAMLAELKAGDLTRVIPKGGEDRLEKMTKGLPLADAEKDIPVPGADASPDDSEPFIEAKTPKGEQASLESDATAERDISQPFKAEEAIPKPELESEGKARDKPQCTNCGATSTPLWRRDANFELQCNACGLYEKLHKAPRPKTLKQRRSDRRVIKDSPTGEAGASQRSSLSPSNTTSTGRDEWLGIHAGATCANCGTSTTPLWRKDREGRIICNACGLYYKLHNAHRPVTMRMDAIKRRSRYDDRRRTATIGSEASSEKINGFDQALASSSSLEEDDEMGQSYHTYAPMPAPHMFPQQSPAYGHLGGLNPQGPNAPFTGDQLMTPGPHTMAPHYHNHHQHVQNANHPVFPAVIPPPPQHGGIHIPAALWEHQVCPMGAWGEECCQNLPQPPPDVQSALMASAAATAAANMQELPAPHTGAPQHQDQRQRAENAHTPIETQEALNVSAAMNALLGSGDWMLDFGCGTGLPAESLADFPMQAAQSIEGGASTSQQQQQQQQHFDPTAVSGSPDASVVGPTFPLKRRRGGGARASASADVSIIAGDADFSAPLPTQSHALVPIASPTSQAARHTPPGSSAADGSEAAQMATSPHWWPFVTPPETVK